MTSREVQAPIKPNVSSLPADEGSQASLLRNGALLALAAGHGAVDICANILPVFYPLLVSALGLSYGTVSVLTTVQSTASSLCQPFFGWAADRFGTRWMAPLTVMGAGFAIALVGFAPSYATLLVVVAFLGLAVGAWHPLGAKLASLIGGRWRTTSLSIYMVGGNAGYSSGPLLAAAVLAPAGITSTVWLAIPGVMAAMFLMTQGRRLESVSAAATRAVGGHRGLAASGIAIFALAVASVARAWITYSLIAFIPLLYAARGDGPIVAGQILFFLLVMEGAGTVLGGWMADRIGRRLTLLLSFLVLAPAVYLLIPATGLAAFFFSAIAGLSVGTSVTVTLVAAQEILPSRMGMASGISISLGNIMGGFGVALQGVLADQYGLVFAVELLVLVSLVGAVTSIRVAEGRAR